MLKIMLAAGTLFLTANVSAGTGPDGGIQPSVKCGTPAVLAEYKANGYRTMSDTRYAQSTVGYINDLDTALPLYAVSDEGNFRAHYDTTDVHAPSLEDFDSNGIPDYVDSTLVYLEYAWGLIIDDLGYDIPRSDEGRGGGNEVDVYIINMNGYGATYPEATANGSSASYLVIDNNFSESIFYTHGYDALKVTTAHEFFHVIHFSYFTDYEHMHWWMEQSAVWMEDRAWDDVNDYFNYLKYFFNQKMTSLDDNNSYNNYMYGAAIWPMYLAKRFGDDQIRLIWENARTTGNHTINGFNMVIPGGLRAAFNEFATWNYFIGFRANSYFHHDSPLFEVSDVVDAIYTKPPAIGSLEANALTSRYIEFRFTSDFPGRDIIVDLTPQGGAFIGKLILYGETGEFQIEPLDEGVNQIPLDRAWDRAALVMSCTDTYGGGYVFEYDGNITSITLVKAETAPQVFTVTPPQPNPFNPTTAIGFTLPSDGDVAITAFNLQGQVVDEIARGFFPAGSHRIDWRPANLAGGVYLIRIATPHGVKTIKSLYLK